MLEEKAYGKDLDELRDKLGLDRPIYIQYFEWLGQIGRGDLGESLWTQAARSSRSCRVRLPVSLVLGVLALCFAVVIAFPIGVLSAVRPDTARDYVARSVAILGLSVPGFWIATLVIVLPAIWWGWTPPIRFTEFSKFPSAHVLQFLLPAFILGIASAAAIMRLTRAMLLEVLRQDYVRTAWAKGLREGVVVLKHSLKNALIPVVTILGIQLAQIFSGTVIIESIFQLPGMGRFLFDAINQRDYPVIQGINLVVVSVIVLMNLVVDSSTRSSTRGSGTPDGQLHRDASRRRPVGPAREAAGRCRLLGAVCSSADASRSAPSAASSCWSCSSWPSSRRWIAHYAYDETIRGGRMKAPGAQFWMGTDNLSRDIWSRVVYGARVSVTVGFVTILLANLLATAVGVTSAYLGGEYDIVRPARRGRVAVLPVPRDHPLDHGRAGPGAPQPHPRARACSSPPVASRVIRGATSA